MKERGILFSAPMVRALLAGTKTQTRRVLKQATGLSLSVGIDDDVPGAAELSWLHGDGPGHEVHETIKRVLCPYGAPGDRLWVRETWAKAGGGTGFWYRATDSEVDDGNSPVSHWRPSIFMPRAASRITLEVTEVRVERLQAISNEDAIAEGSIGGEIGGLSISAFDNEVHLTGPRGIYAKGWEQINGAGSWDANPWVWCVSFRRL